MFLPFGTQKPGFIFLHLAAILQENAISKVFIAFLNICSVPLACQSHIDLHSIFVIKLLFLYFSCFSSAFLFCRIAILK